MHIIHEYVTLKQRNGKTVVIDYTTAKANNFSNGRGQGINGQGGPKGKGQNANQFSKSLMKMMQIVKGSSFVSMVSLLLD